MDSLKQRLLARLGPPLFVLLALGALMTFLFARHIGTMVYDRWLYDSAMTLGKQVRFGPGGVSVDAPPSALTMFEWDSVDSIYESVSSLRQGVILANSVFPPAPTGHEPGDVVFFNSVIRGHSTRVVALFLSNPHDRRDPVVVQVAETTHKRDSLTASILGLVLPLLAATLAVAALLIRLAVRSSLRTIDDITERVARYEPAALAPIADVEHSPAEVRPLLEAINQLVVKLAEAQEVQRRFIANAAHQLRTPLAALQVQTERALRETDPAHHREALSHVLAAVGRAQHLVQQLLTLARSEPAGAPTGDMQPVDLAALAREVLESWIDAALERQVDIGYEGPEQGVSVRADPHLLRELIGNLIDNAIKYGHRGGRITLRLTRAPATLVVDDDGPGIPQAERERVLERFYRRPDSGGSGCGLGLAIANEIAARHKATLRILDNPGGRGTRIEVAFSGGDARNGKEVGPAA